MRQLIIQVPCALYTSQYCRSGYSAICCLCAASTASANRGMRVLAASISRRVKSIQMLQGEIAALREEIQELLHQNSKQ
jgi:Tfp pilus assembly protein PilN